MYENDLDQVIGEYHLLKHPFYQRWVEGRLSKDELKRYAAQYYEHILAFPTYVSATHANSRDIEVRQMLLENLIEEERGKDNHPELWVRFGESLGISRKEMEDVESIPEARQIVDTFQGLTKKSLASGLGALYAYESQVPAVAEKKIEGLKKHYGMEDGDKGLTFFEVHEEADKHHSKATMKVMNDLSAEEKQEALEAAKVAAKTLWSFLSGLDRESMIERTNLN